MKKLMITAVAALGLSLGVKAASVSWQYNGVKAETGYNVYLVVGSTAITSMDSVADFLANNVTVGAAQSVIESGPPSGRTYTAKANILQDSKIAKGDSYYFVMIDGDATSAKNFYTSSVYAGDNIYDTDLQDPKPGTTTFSSWAKGPTAIGAVPEPTSGLLLLLGVAGIALKRKRA